MKDERVRCVCCKRKKQSPFVYYLRFHPKAPFIRVCQDCLLTIRDKAEFAQENDRPDSCVMNRVGSYYNRVDIDVMLNKD